MRNGRLYIGAADSVAEALLKEGEQSCGRM